MSDFQPNYKSDEIQIIEAEHLRLLSLVFKIFGGIHLVISFLPIFHLILGLMISFFPSPDNADDPFFRGVGVMFSLFAGLFIFIGVTISVLQFKVGQFLEQRTNHLFCLMISAISMLSVPYGTVLGLFTFLTLSKPSVKATFQ
jgi:hypothetical protein